MVRLQNHIGKIDISEAYFEDLVSDAVNSSFGVAAMSETSSARGFWNKVLKKDSHNGILIKYQKSRLVIELHIIDQLMEPIFLRLSEVSFIKCVIPWKKRPV